MKSILKYPGAKWRIAPWIIDKMPQHHSYLEPYFGSGAVLFSKEPSRIETINDLDDDVVNLFNVIRTDSEKLCAMIAATPYAREEYECVYRLPETNEPYEKARRFLIKSWQGHGFRTSGKVGWKNDVQGREAAYSMRNWYRLPEWVSDIVERLKEVQIEHRPAIEVIKRFNYPNVLIYADPPYVLSTRTRKNYRHEMTDNDHVELLEILMQHIGTVMLSGYDNELYDRYLNDWEKHQIETTAEYGKHRVETLWIKKRED